MGVQKGQHIDAGTALLDFFLLGHPEPLFLVDDQKSQILELTSEESSL